MALPDCLLRAPECGKCCPCHSDVTSTLLVALMGPSWASRPTGYAIKIKHVVFLCRKMSSKRFLLPRVRPWCRNTQRCLLTPILYFQMIYMKWLFLMHMASEAAVQNLTRNAAYWIDEGHLLGMLNIIPVLQIWEILYKTFRKFCQFQQLRTSEISSSRFLFVLSWASLTCLWADQRTARGQRRTTYISAAWRQSGWRSVGRLQQYWLNLVLDKFYLSRWWILTFIN